MKKLSIIVALLAPALAFADAPKTPEQWYKFGSNQYDLGNFDGAVDAFKKGFELETSASKRPAYLYNIAQAYRQAKNCKDAEFFYKRYLALRDDDKTKPLSEKKHAEIDKIIDQLDACVKQQEALAKKPPDGAPDDHPPIPVPPKPVAVVTPVEPHDEVAVTATTAPEEQPHTISLRLLGGATKIMAGNLDVPIQANLGVLGGYPLAINEDVTLEVGGALLFQPVPYVTSSNMTGSGQMVSVLANAGATYHVAPRVGIRGDLGLGLLLLAGVSASPFTGDKETTGALTMLNVRVGVSADIAITPNIVGTIMPFAFSYSPPKDGLRSDITSITRIDFMIGVGYRM